MPKKADVISSINAGNASVSETLVCGRLRAAMRPYEKREEPIPDELEWDWTAFALEAQRNQTTDNRSTRFGPTLVGQNADGSEWASPDIARISASTISYWKSRATTLAHPILTARYADLVWDLELNVTGSLPDVKYARLAVDEYVRSTVEKKWAHNVNGIDYLTRALNLAQSVSDQGRVKTVRDSIIEFENEIEELEKPGTWGFAFDLLVENKKAQLSNEQRDALITEMRDRVRKVSDTVNGDNPIDPYIAECGAMRLAKYFRRKNDMKSARDAVRSYGQICIQRITTNPPNGMVAYSWLRKLFDTFLDFGMKTEADAIAVQMQSMGNTAKAEMLTFSHKINVPKVELEKYYSKLLEGTTETILAHIAAHFIPDPNQAAEQVKLNAKIAPLSSIIPQTIVDHDGREIAQIGSFDNDLEGRVIRQVCLELMIGGTFLHEALTRARTERNIKCSDISDFILKSPLVPGERASILRVALDAFAKCDHITCVYLLVPLVEAPFRQILLELRVSTYKPGKYGGLALKTLGDILQEPVVEAVFGKNFVSYARILLVDQRGWNIRNDICHGITKPEMIGAPTTVWLIHILLVLGCARPNGASGGNTVESEDAESEKRRKT